MVGGATTLAHSASVLFIILMALSKSPSSSAPRAFSTDRMTSAGTCRVWIGLMVSRSAIGGATEMTTGGGGVGAKKRRSSRNRTVDRLLLAGRMRGRPRA